jgi:hypothetical protein
MWSADSVVACTDSIFLGRMIEGMSANFLLKEDGEYGNAFTNVGMGQEPRTGELDVGGLRGCGLWAGSGLV